MSKAPFWGAEYVSVQSLNRIQLFTILKSQSLYNPKVPHNSLQLFTKDGRTAGFAVLHYFLGFAQIQVRWLSDAIQPSHPLSSLSPLSTFGCENRQLPLLFGNGRSSRLINIECQVEEITQFTKKKSSMLKKNKLTRLRKIRNGSRKSRLQFNIRLANMLNFGDMWVMISDREIMN